jgi:hypothetical protein
MGEREFGPREAVLAGEQPAREPALRVVVAVAHRALPALGQEPLHESQEGAPEVGLVRRDFAKGRRRDPLGLAGKLHHGGL